MANNKMPTPTHFGIFRIFCIVSFVQRNPNTKNIIKENVAPMPIWNPSFFTMLTSKPATIENSRGQRSRLISLINTFQKNTQIR